MARPAPPAPATAATTTRRPTLSPSRSRLGSARAIDQRGRAETRQYIDQQHFAAIGLDDLMADDLLAGIIPALHQHARLDLPDQPDRGVFFKNRDEIDRLQRRQYLRARALVLHRTPLALQPLHRCIAVEADNQA